MSHTPHRAPAAAGGAGDDPSALTGRPVVFGEVLFDHFPDGRQRLGGAPFNVAWHLQGFGLAPLLVTRIGRDEPGDRIVDAMLGWGLDTSAVQRDGVAPTGAVEVSFDGSQPSFDIRPGQAYDHLDATDAVTATTAIEPALLYHGTLIARSPLSAAALRALRGRTSLPVFLDVNLRPPWWSADVVRSSLFGTRWAKLNQDELQELAPPPRTAGIAAATDGSATDTAAAAFRRSYALDTVIVTLGSDGALMSGDDGTIRGAAPAPDDGGDTVGAGDAFSAVAITGILRGWPRDVTLRRALEFASLVCSVQGAIMADSGVYENLVSRWAAEAARASATGA